MHFAKLCFYSYIASWNSFKRTKYSNYNGQNCGSSTVAASSQSCNTQVCCSDLYFVQNGNLIGTTGASNRSSSSGTLSGYYYWQTTATSDRAYLYWTDLIDFSKYSQLVVDATLISLTTTDTGTSANVFTCSDSGARCSLIYQTSKMFSATVSNSIFTKGIRETHIFDFLISSSGYFKFVKNATSPESAGKFNLYNVYLKCK